MKLATLNGGDQLVRAATEGGFRGRWVMITPTYRPGRSWSGRHISQLCKHIRQWLERKGHRARYAWVAELQERRQRRTGERGADVVHYHLIVWVPYGLDLPFPDTQGWWPHGSTKIGRARKPVGYLSKYQSKGSVAGEFPKGLRLHGRGGLDELGRRVVSWWLLPRYVREFAEVTYERIRRAPGGGWVSRDSGQWWPSWGTDLQLQGAAL